MARPPVKLPVSTSLVMLYATGGALSRRLSKAFMGRRLRFQNTECLSKKPVTRQDESAAGGKVALNSRMPLTEAVK